jgi:hypothetical protein
VAPPPSAAPTKAAPPPKPQVGWSISATPGFSYESANEKVDFNGYNLAVSESRTPAVSLPIGVKYTGNPRPFGVQPYFSLNLTPGYSDIEAKSSTSSLFASEEDPTAIQSVVASSESHTYKQTYLGLVEAMYPLSDPIDVTLSYVNDQTYVQASPKLARIFSGPKGKITIEVDRVKVDGIVSVINEENKALALLDADTKVKTDQTLQGIVSVTGDDSLTKLDVSSIQTESVSEKGTKSVMLGKATWDKPIADFNLGLGLNYASRTPYENSLLTLVQSAGSERGVSANLGWSGFFGISITGGFSYTLLEKLDYLSKSEDKTELISSNGDSISYSLIGSIPIFGAFGGLDLSYRYTDRKIDPPGELDPATQIAILKNFWSQTTSTSVKLSVRFPL